MSPTYEDLVALIRWLSLPYQDAEPIFAVTDADGTTLDEGARRAATWRSIMGAQHSHAPEGSGWSQCAACKRWSVTSAPVAVPS